MVDALLKMDGEILLFIQDHIRQEWMDWFWKAVTHLGDGGVFWILLGIILLFSKKTRPAGVTALLALLVGALITNVCLKNFVARIRPYEVVEGLRLMIERQRDYSFPSGHTSASFAAACALVRTLPKKWGTVCMILAGVIALSRLYVGVHYPSDVLGGMVVGIFAGWAGWKLMQMLMLQMEKKRRSV